MPEDIKTENSAGAKTPVQANEESGCILRIEELLKQQAENNKKMLKSSRVRTVAVLAMVVVFIVFAVMIYGKVGELTAGLPDLVEAANALVEKASGDLDDLDELFKDLDGVFKNVAAINFQGINDLINGLQKIDFDSLGKSVDALGDGVQSFQDILEALSNPFGRIGQN